MELEMEANKRRLNLDHRMVALDEHGEKEIPVTREMYRVVVVNII